MSTLYQFDVILMDKKLAFLSKKRTFLSDQKLLNGSVYMSGDVLTLSQSQSSFLCSGVDEESEREWVKMEMLSLHHFINQ